jgi:hypothetical protein
MAAAAGVRHKQAGQAIKQQYSVAVSQAGRDPAKKIGLSLNPPAAHNVGLLWVDAVVVAVVVVVVSRPAGSRIETM